MTDREERELCLEKLQRRGCVEGGPSAELGLDLAGSRGWGGGRDSLVSIRVTVGVGWKEEKGKVALEPVCNPALGGGGRLCGPRRGRGTATFMADSPSTSSRALIADTDSLTSLA